MTTLFALIALVLQDAPPADHLRLAIAPAETLHVSISGAGSPIVFVPGLLGGGFGFRKVASLLNEAGFRTYAIDPLGSGRSTRPRNADYSLDAQADRYAAALDSLRVHRAGLVAHAIGGSIALRLATRRPELVGTILLLDSGPAESATTEGLRRALKLAPLLQLLGAGRMRSRIRGQMIDASGDPAWVEPAVVAAYTDDATRDLSATLNVLRAMTRAQEREPLGPRLSSIRAPVHALIGGSEHAGAPSPAEIERLAHSVSGFEADTLGGVGHFLHEEAPHAVRDAVLRMHNPGTMAADGRAAAPVRVFVRTVTPGRCPS